MPCKRVFRLFCPQAPTVEPSSFLRKRAGAIHLWLKGALRHHLDNFAGFTKIVAIHLWLKGALRHLIQKTIGGAM